MNILNEKLGTSNKAQQSELGKMYIVNKINDNQKIRRLTRYLTKTPLSQKGKSYNGEVLLDQPDLEFGLLEDLKTNQDIKAIARDIVLIPYSFDEELLDKDKIFIFVDDNSARFSSRSIYGEYLYEVSIVYSKPYDKLLPIGTTRSGKIMAEICEMFDSVYSEGDYAEELGNVEFKIDSFGKDRISSQGYIKNVIFITSKPLTDRRL